MDGADEVDDFELAGWVWEAGHHEVLAEGSARSRKCFRCSRVERFWNGEGEENEQASGDHGGYVEAPSPGEVFFDVASDDGRDVAARDEANSVDAHVETSFVGEEDVGHRGAA